ncbi:hypothetical protein, variant [Phytophthora nicotianae P10297]|uniref:Uncharacterized protein n=4 Tax=Phytophthora nicotianae TaxID=4792 RepID=V9DXZ6_PHYNI|nr:hypothetical protein, variant [Phytophthora nicotianae P1569]ETL25580.1 hypothetical protein, variant [Phytophthora nicotianae]ETM32064.1 hypothetical protein, variant [Phytophthora nicotianae]ETO60469.1 hypothetical protein, variant [Phytophthora nicotianae P1976]ETP29741.1 hypothetical protein, variant [Phytophthora nicotianae P10297]
MLAKLAVRRGLVLPRRLQTLPPLAAPRVLTTPLIRALSNASSGRPDGFYVSKKAVKMTLALGAALTGGILYLERENADRKKIRFLLELSQLSLEKGEIEQSMRERKEAYNLLKKKFPHDKSVVAMAMMIGASYEKTEQFEEAIPFYSDALENITLETRMVQCEDLRVVLLDRLGQCYKQTGDPVAAEKHFKQAIEAYDQLKGKLALSSDSDLEASILSKFDEDILNVFLHYTVLLTVLRRPDDATQTRRRLATIARGSPQLRGQVARINRQVDDYIALEKIREERKLVETKVDEESDFV